MAESSLLLSTAQSEFKEDVIRALLLDDTINVHVKRSLEGLSSKRNFKLEELRKQWLNRGGHNYLTVKQIIETNVEFREEQNQIVDDKTGWINISEKNLQISIDGSSWGFNPRTRKFDEQVVFNSCVSTTFGRFRNLVDVEPLSGAVNLLSTLSSFIAEGKRLHFNDSHFCQVLIFLAKNFVPLSFPSLARFQSEAERLFEAFIQIISSDQEIQKLRNALAKVCRQPGYTIGEVILKIRSLYSSIFSIAYPNMSPDTTRNNVERIIFQTIAVFLSPKTLQLLHTYVSERVLVGKDCSLNKIIEFINRAESSIDECAFMGSVTLPRNLTVLDQVQCSDSSALNLTTIQSNLTLLSSNAANLYSRKGYAQPDNGERGHRGRSKFHYRKENFEKGFGRKEEKYRGDGLVKNQDYYSHKKNGQSYEGSGDFDQRGRDTFAQKGRISLERRSRSRHRSGSRESNSGQRELERSRSRSNDRGNARSRSRSPGNESANKYSRSRSGSMERSCKRCGKDGHDGKFCKSFAYCESRCRHCDLFHRSHLCNQNKKKVETNTVEVEATDPDVMVTNMIDLSWIDEGKANAEILTDLTALPEWDGLI